MSTRNVATVATADRKPRCRMTDRLGDRCPNEVADDDPAVIQICPAHALRAALMLQDNGAIRIQFANAHTRRSA